MKLIADIDITLATLATSATTTTTAGPVTGPTTSRDAVGIAAGMPRFKLAPALGWPVGATLAVIMVLAGVLCVIDYVRRSGRTSGQTSRTLAGGAGNSVTPDSARPANTTTGTETDETVWACIRRTLICLCIAAMALTPSLAQPNHSRAVNATDVVIATDVTGSMAVQDAQYGSDQSVSRLTAAKDVTDDLVNLYSNASFSAISFGASASVDVPLTPDTGAIENWAENLQPEATKLSAGSTLDTPLDQLLVNLKSIRSGHTHDTIVLYIITDGEQTSSKARRSFSSLRQYLDAAFTVAVGSTAGGKIPEITTEPGKAQGTADDDGTSEETKTEHWVIDPTTGQPGISVMDGQSLKTLADEMSGTAVFTGAQQRIGKNDMAPTSRSWRFTETHTQHERLNPVVWPFAIATAVLLALELASWLATSRRLI